MKDNFETEKRKLFEWFQEQNHKNDEDNLYPIAQDGVHTVKDREIVAEFNKRFIALKQKYNVV